MRGTCAGVSAEMRTSSRIRDLTKAIDELEERGLLRSDERALIANALRACVLQSHKDAETVREIASMASTFVKIADLAELLSEVFS